MDPCNLATWASLLPSAFAAIAAICSAYVAVRAYQRAKAADVAAFLRRDEDTGGVMFVVSNIGGGCAWDVAVEDFDYKFVGYRKEGGPPDHKAREDVRRTFIEKGIPMLAPGESRQTFICDSEYAKDEIGDATATVTVRWRQSRRLGLMKSRNSTLDYYSFANTVYAKSNEWHIAKALEKMAGIK